MVIRMAQKTDSIMNCSYNIRTSLGRENAHTFIYIYLPDKMVLVDGVDYQVCSTITIGANSKSFSIQLPSLLLIPTV